MEFGSVILQCVTDILEEVSFGDDCSHVGVHKYNFTTCISHAELRKLHFAMRVDILDFRYITLRCMFHLLGPQKSHVMVRVSHTGIEKCSHVLFTYWASEVRFYDAVLTS